MASKLIVEVKVSQEIERFHMAQVLHYLKATHFEVGLLVNFGRKPEFKRVVYQTSRAREHHVPPSEEEMRTCDPFPSDPPL